MKKYNRYIKGFEEILTSSAILSFIDTFWSDIMINFNSDQVITIIFKVEYDNNITRSFSHAIEITHNNKFKQKLLNEIKVYIQLNSEHYEELSVKNILFDYFPYNTPLSENKFNYLREFIETDYISTPVLVKNNIINDYSFLPKTMDLWL